jgi:hypothetical protein
MLSVFFAVYSERAEGYEDGILLINNIAKLSGGYVELSTIWYNGIYKRI